MSEKFENINGHKTKTKNKNKNNNTKQNKTKQKNHTDNDLHSTTEKTKDLTRGIQQQKRGVK